MALNLSRKRFSDEEEENKHNGGPKRARPTVRVISKAAEAKKEKSKALMLAIGDRFGQSERFELETAYRLHMDPQRDVGRIPSIGIIQPAFQQGAIVVTIFQKVNAWELRAAKTAEQLRVVPLGNKNCGDIVPHDVVIRPFAWRSPTPVVKNGDTSIEGTSAVNGFGRRARAQVVGIAATANNLSKEGDNHSVVIIGGVATTTHTGHQAIPAFATVIASLTPYAVSGDTPSQLVPAIAQAGVPDDKFRVGLHPLDERVIAAIKIRAERQVDAAMDNWRKEYKQSLNDAKSLPAFLVELKSMVATELQGFELNMRDKPSAAHMHWYGLEQAVIHAMQYDWKLSDGDLAAELKAARDKWRPDREDIDFITANGGKVDRSVEGDLRRLLDNKTVTVREAYYTGGLRKMLRLHLHHSSEEMHTISRIMKVGLSLSSPNPGAPLDILGRAG